MANNTRYEELVKMKGAELIQLADGYGLKCAANKERTQLKERKSNVVDRIYDYEQEQATVEESAVETTAEEEVVTPIEASADNAEEQEATVEQEPEENTTERATTRKKAGRSKKALPVAEKIRGTLDALGIAYTGTDKGRTRVVAEDGKSVFTAQKYNTFAKVWVNPIYVESPEKIEALASKIEVNTVSKTVPVTVYVPFENLEEFVTLMVA